ncbi:MAG: aminotransferase class V-fold PLP-dependent enzyme [Patescibacteria group bacterium]|nr:aminotransferase class V-fold PLP-dependent enzyme [Patescibacteria group bacterium]
MIYLDHAATTALDKEIFETMKPYFSEKYGNPSSIYFLGQEAKAAIEEARERVAKILGASPGEIIFTSCATESNNLAIRGIINYQLAISKKPVHIITSSIEHKSVLETCKGLEEKGAEATYLSVDKEGFVNIEDLKKAIKENTVLVSIMYANNEVGSIQPIKEIGAYLKDLNKRRKQPVAFHTDAVQGFQYAETDVQSLGVDALSLTGHKFYAPKGVGILYLKEGIKVESQQTGGSQENKKRAGTENVPYIVAIAEAMATASSKRQVAGGQIRKLRDKLIDGILEKIPGTILTGPAKENFANRLPNNASFCFPKVEGESILINLDFEGIAASSGSACTSGSLEPSHVLIAMGYDHTIAHGSIRFTLGKDNTEEEIDEVLEKLPPIIEKLQKMSPLR